MGGVNKNIRSRKAIRRAAPTLHQPFAAKDMSIASGYGVRRVANLMATMDDFRSELRTISPPRVWWFEPK